jgi:hypothetical protein
MDVDAFATHLLEEAKRFLERATATDIEDARTASLHAALLLAFASLEAHLNSIADDFLVRNDLSILDRSTLSERDFTLEQGRWTLTDRLHMYRIEDRVEHLHNSFSITPLDKTASSWSQLKEGLSLRNRLTHPRQRETITPEQVSRALSAVVETLDALYVAIYKRPLPSKQRGLSSSLDF